ncbi:MAG TPA: DUF4395 domain-containing protein [Actinomycetota bacterium]|nr:DUF4395 domain-containing protein [Actinomycetota bacterium]
MPRGKAAFHTLLPVAAFLLDQPFPPVGKVLVAFTGIAMAVSVAGGPRWSLFGRLFHQVVRPALGIGPGTRQAAAPHRFAETIGAVFLLAATLAFLLGAPVVGWGLSLIVAALAALNWLAGICVGCRMYVMLRRLGARAPKGA